jgi:hypothetical protein
VVGTRSLGTATCPRGNGAEWPVTCSSGLQPGRILTTFFRSVCHICSFCRGLASSSSFLSTVSPCPLRLVPWNNQQVGQRRRAPGRLPVDGMDGVHRQQQNGKTVGSNPPRLSWPYPCRVQCVPCIPYARRRVSPSIWKRRDATRAASISRTNHVRGCLPPSLQHSKSRERIAG